MLLGLRLDTVCVHVSTRLFSEKIVQNKVSKCAHPIHGKGSSI